MNETANKPAPLRHTLASFVSIFFSLYFVSVMFTVPFFNYRYAKNHGFMSWILFGEIVATAQSVVWPYYAVTALQERGGVGDTEDDLDDLDAHLEDDDLDAHYVNSRRASHRALVIINDEGGLMRLTDRKRKDVVPLLESAVAEATLVQESFLQQVHADFPRQWRDGYTAALADMIEGLQAEDENKQIAGATKYNIFKDWCQKTHEMEILR